MTEFIERIYTAAKNRWMLVLAVVDGVEVFVNFAAPDRTLFDGFSRATDYTIEFPASWLPDLRRGVEIEVGGVGYQVRDVFAVSDGSEKRALLTRLDE